MTKPYIYCIYKYIQYMYGLMCVRLLVEGMDRRMIEVENLTKELGTFSLKGITFSLPRGYICGLLGENGAGKSTLIKTMAGIYRMDDGSCRIDGQDIDKQEAGAKDCLGIVLDEPLFENRLTPMKISRLYGLAYSKFEPQTYLDYLHRFGINPNQKVGRMSKGMRIKLQLAFALSHQARVFLMDEPTGSMDKEFRSEFWEICAKLIEDEDKSILISSHLTGDLDRKADYIAYMQDGELLFFKTIEELRDTFTLVKAENYKLKLIPADRVVYYEAGEYGGTALVTKEDRLKKEKGYELMKPDLRQLMYFLSKGGKEHAKNIVQKYL